MKTDSEHVLWCLESGNYRLTAHAKQRALERGIEPADIRTLGQTGIVFLERGTKKFLIKGSDFSGDSLTVIAVLEFDVLIITIF